jgi:hypothetical protein
MPLDPMVRGSGWRRPDRIAIRIILYRQSAVFAMVGIGDDALPTAVVFRHGNAALRDAIRPGWRTRRTFQAVRRCSKVRAPSVHNE